MSAKTLIFGFHAVEGRIRQNPESVTEVYLDRARVDARARGLIALCEGRGIKLIQLDSARVDGMVGGKSHQGVAAKIEANNKYIALDDVLDTLSEPALLLVLDGVQDPHNLGACLRVADAFGAHAVIAPKDRAVGLNATVAKVASGAAETVPFIAVTNLARTLRELREREIEVVGTALDTDTELYDAKISGPVAWVLGAEGMGMRRLTRENCDRLVKIPMQGMVQSLNVSVTSGILLYETCRQRRIGQNPSAALPQ